MNYKNYKEKFVSQLFLPNNGLRNAEGGGRLKGIFKENHDSQPLISIITIVYNGAKHIEQTIQSVINQSYDNIEYIIIDGGSTDGTLDIIQKYDNTIDYWISEKDQGISDAFNKGIICSTGTLIGMINADDYYEENALSYISKAYMDYGNSPVVLYGKTFRESITGIKSEKTSNKLSWCLSVPFSHCSSFASKSYYSEMGLFDTNYKIAMDVDLLMRGLNQAKYVELQQFIATQRDGGVSDENRVKGYREYLKASAKHCNLFLRYFYFILKVGVIYKNKVLNK